MDTKISWLKFLDTLFAYFPRLPLLQPDTDKPQKILLIKLAAFGDLLCLLPSLAYLREHFPASEIHLLTTQRSLPAFWLQTGLYERVHDLSMNPIALISMVLELRAQNYDLVIDFDQYYLSSEWIAGSTGKSIGFLTPLKGQSHKLTKVYDEKLNEKLNFLELTTLSSPYTPRDLAKYIEEVHLTLSAVPSEKLQGLLKSLAPQKKNLVIYPGSSPNALFRRWPISRFLALAGLLAGKFNVIFAGGPAEQSFSDQIAGSGIACFNWIGVLTLQDWGYFFANHTRLFVGNDAGLTHLADAVGCSCSIIFGPNLGSKWGSLRADSDNIELGLGCSPCIDLARGIVPSECWRGDIACLGGISVEMVLDVIEAKLGTDDNCFLKGVIGG